MTELLDAIIGRVLESALLAGGPVFVPDGPEWPDIMLALFELAATHSGWIEAAPSAPTGQHPWHGLID